MSSFGGLSGSGEVNAGATTLMRQAVSTAEDYLEAAIQAVESRDLGRDPLLIATFMRVAAQDFQTAVEKIAMQDLRDALREPLHAIAEALNNFVLRSE